VDHLNGTQFLRSFIVVVCTTVAAHAQIGVIDKSKLPQDAAVLAAYGDLSSIDQFARTYEAKWRFPIPKEQVAARFSVGLRTLRAAQEKNPANAELQLLTGLTAHLAYNLDINEAYEPSMKLLGPLTEGPAADYRASWFLGMHQCQSNDNLGGMKRLLTVEDSTTNLPRVFWQDYANCATVSSMPAHAIRAYDNAAKVPQGPVTDAALEQIARKRVTPSDPTKTYAQRSVWSVAQTKESVRFTSTLCGESFAIKPDAHLSLGDVKDGKCVVSIESDQFPNRHGSSSSTSLLLSMQAKSGQSLEQYAQGFLKGPYASARPIEGIPCPVAHCLSYEIVTDKLYSGEGGAHLLAIFFASEEPEYSGLKFETPQPLPKPDAKSNPNEPVFYRTDDTLQRFHGTLYTFAALDANADIYAKARPEFDSLLKSLVIDTK